MSVVNKMLKDLETREATQALHADYQPPAKRIPWWWILLLTVVVGTLLWFVLYKPELTGKLDLTQTAMPKAIVSAPVEAVIPSPESHDAPKAAIQQTQVQGESTVQQALQSESTESELRPNQVIREDIPKAAASKNVLQPPAQQDLQAHSKSEPAASTPTESSFSISSNGQQDKAAQLRHKALQAVQANNNGEAINALNALTRLEPDNIVARKKLAALLFANGKQEQAKLQLIDMLRAKPEQADVRMMLARLYVQEEQPQQAFDLLVQQPENAFLSLDFLAFRAALSQQLGHNDQALLDYESLARLEPDNGRWWLGLGVSHDQLGQAEHAKKTYEAARHQGSMSSDVERFIAQRIRVLAVEQ